MSVEIVGCSFEEKIDLDDFQVEWNGKLISVYELDRQSLTHLIHQNLRSILTGVLSTHSPKQHIILPLKSGGSVEVGVDIKWGGQNGTQVSGHAKAEVHDDKGNYVEVEAEQESDGSGSASVSAGHKEEKRLNN